MKPKPSKKRITITDIATRAGVSHTTVSRALNGSPHISLKTRNRIQELADKMGYSPDPMITALMKYRDQLINHKSTARLAIVSGPSLRKYWTNFKASISAHAKRLGYDCEDYIWDASISPERHSDILRSRGIKGIILGPFTEDPDQESPGLKWDDFATVTIGRFVKSPKLDSVGDNPFQAVSTALANASELGAKRCGLLTTKRINLHSSDRLRAAFATHMRKSEDQDRIRPLLIDEIAPYAKFENVFNWMREYRLDTIISQKHIIERIANSGRIIPDDTRFITLDIWKSNITKNNFCGITRDDTLLARTAVAVLHDHIIHGNFGIPNTPKDILLDNAWTSGLSRFGEIR